MLFGDDPLHPIHTYRQRAIDNYNNGDKIILRSDPYHPIELYEIPEHYKTLKSSLPKPKIYKKYKLKTKKHKILDMPIEQKIILKNRCIIL